MKNLVFPRIFLHCVALGFIVSGLLLRISYRFDSGRGCQICSVRLVHCRFSILKKDARAENRHLFVNILTCRSKHCTACSCFSQIKVRTLSGFSFPEKITFCFIFTVVKALKTARRRCQCFQENIIYNAPFFTSALNFRIRV